MTSKILTKTCPEIQQGCEEKGVWSGRSGTSEGSGEYTGHQRREVNTNLGGTIQSYRHCKRRGVLFGGFGRETTPLAIECPQFEEILPLIISTRGYILSVMLCVYC